jgi:long-chain acyl-CoA synthetase
MSERAPARPGVGPGENLPLAARRHPDKIALICNQRRLTYRELDELSAAVAVALCQRGIGPGDVVSLNGQNSWEWIVTYHGALRAGAVVNPANVMLTGDELRYVLTDCKAKALFAGAAQLPIALSATEGGEPLVDFVFSSADCSAPGALSLTQLAGGCSPVPIRRV